MFALFGRRSRKSAFSSPRSVRPSLESLETRDCPSVISLNVAYGTQNNVTLSGKVSATTNPGGLTVRLGGEVNGTAVTDANGNYSVTLPAAGVGNVWAMTADGQSNSATATLTDTAPVISNFTAVETTGDMWTFSGDVNYRDPNGLTMHFGGLASLQNQTTTVDSHGYFSLTLVLNGTSTDNGIAGVYTTDWYGLMSNSASTAVSQS